MFWYTEKGREIQNAVTAQVYEKIKKSLLTMHDIEIGSSEQHLTMISVSLLYAKNIFL